MRLTCQTNDLIGGLSVATRALSARTTQPIYESLLLRAKDGTLEITCSDGAISIVTRVAAQIEEDGALALPGKLFSDIIRKMPTGEISLSVNENFLSTIRCQGARMTLAGQDGALYPSLPLVSAENSFELPQALLRDMIQQTGFAIAIDDQRKVLNGCLLDIQNGEARMVALDGFRLALRLARLSDSTPELSAIIPGKTVQEIARILSDDEDARATLLIGGNQMVVLMGETRFYTTLIDGEYINYRQILPTGWKTRVKFSRDTFLTCVDRAALMAREGKNNLFRLAVEEGRMIITSNSENGEAYDEIEADVEGDPLTIAFNVQYALDVLRALPDGEAYMRFNSPVSPCVVCPIEGDDFEYLMLPVRVNA